MNSDTRTELAFRRRLALLALLHKRPHSYDKIVAALDRDGLFVYDHEDDEAAIARLQLYQFRNDLRTLRALDYQIKFDRKSNCYIWHNSPFGLYLDETQLSSFALLLDTFSNSTILHAADAHALLTDLMKRLPAEQQEAVRGQRRVFSIDLHEATDYRKADPKNLKQIALANQRGQQLEFMYCTPRDGVERRHVIEPSPLKFEREHVYLRGWSLEWEMELRFRLDNILPSTAKMLHKPIVRNRPAPSPYLLHYHLTATIARNSVSQHFSEQKVEKHPDGSATITAHTTDLFEARRILLSYGENCTVLGPPELVKQMRTVGAHFHKTYPTPDE